MTDRTTSHYWQVGKAMYEVYSPEFTRLFVWNQVTECANLLDRLAGFVAEITYDSFKCAVRTSVMSCWVCKSMALVDACYIPA